MVQVFTTYWVAIRSDTIEEGPSGTMYILVTIQYSEKILQV